MLILKFQFQKRLVYALLHVALEHVAPPELDAAELAGVAGRDAALVALMPDKSRLVEVAPATPITPVLVGQRPLRRPTRASLRGRGGPGWICQCLLFFSNV